MAKIIKIHPFAVAKQKSKLDLYIKHKKEIN
jgi:hypothetical protein